MKNPECDISDVIEKVKDYLEEHPEISQERFAKMANMSGGSLSTILAGKYKGRVENIAKKLLTVLEAEESREYAKTTVREPEIVNTTVMGKIWSCLTYANARNDIVVIYGPPGIGKTCALRKWSQEHNSLIGKVGDKCIHNVYAPPRAYKQEV